VWRTSLALEARREDWFGGSTSITNSAYSREHELVVMLADLLGRKRYYSDAVTFIYQPVPEDGERPDRPGVKVPPPEGGSVTPRPQPRPPPSGG
jgi:hypothetical protein